MIPPRSRPLYDQKIAALGAVMAEKLEENSFKPHWNNAEQGYLLRRLSQEVGELRRAVKEHADLKRKRGRGKATDVQVDCAAVALAREAADVANFALFLADNAGALDLLEPSK